MKKFVVLVFFVVSLVITSFSFISCSYFGRQQAKVDSVQTSMDQVPVSVGGKFVTIEQLKTLALDKLVYFKDPITCLYFAATSSKIHDSRRPTQGEVVLSITQLTSPLQDVEKAHLEKVTVYILKRE